MRTIIQRDASNHRMFPSSRLTSVVGVVLAIFNLKCLTLVIMQTPEKKVALITGGAGGIGLSMTKKLLENGAKGVAILDWSEEAGQKALEQLTPTFGNKVIFVKANVAVTEELEAAFETTVTTFKQLDIVINNAAILDEINWKRVISVNLNAVVEGTYLALEKYLPKYKSGEEVVIVNTASILGLTTTQLQPIYCTTKHALIGFGRSLGGDAFYEKYKVRVLTICPGLVLTDMAKCSLTGKGILFPERSEAEFKDYQPQSPDNLGNGLIDIIKNGKTGSVWVVQNDEPAFEVVEQSIDQLKKS